jgi:hypothetical protein
VLLIADEVKNAKPATEAAQQRQKSHADSKRRAVEFAVGQEVLLSTTNIKPKFKGSAQLLPKWIGPFKVRGLLHRNWTYSRISPSSKSYHTRHEQAVLLFCKPETYS